MLRRSPPREMLPRTNYPSMQPAQSLATQSNLVRTASATEIGQQATESVQWQAAMKRAIRSGSVLRERLGLPPIQLKAEKSPSTSGVDDAEADFPTFVPLEFLSRIRSGDLNDPLLRQVLPVEEETKVANGFSSDPVGDLSAMATPGVLHKYNGRALVITTGACGVHCRYCFRREFPYSTASDGAQSHQSVIEYLRRTPSIEEVLLSGGDPLTLVDDKLLALISQIESIAHVRRLRVHTRMPIVIPQRVTPALVTALKESRLAIWFVVHVNHAQEWDESVAQSIASLIDAGIPVLNQSVLLRGVNDNVDALTDLSRLLVNQRVQPYYLHQLDRVRGAAHFEVAESVGLELVEQLRGILPGYAVPTYVRETQGEPSKTVI